MCIAYESRDIGIADDFRLLDFCVAKESVPRFESVFIDLVS